MKYLLAVGACYIDTILNCEHYPHEDEKLRASSIIRRRGGNCPNTLEVLEQLLDLDDENVVPICLALAATLPSASSLGTQQIKSSFGPHVDLSHCLYRDACQEPASSYIVRSAATDSRTIINYNELPEMTSEEFIAIVDKGRIPEVTLECMRYLRLHFPAVQISVELEKPARKGLQALTAEADVVFYSKSWAQGHGHKSPKELLQAQNTLAPKAFLLCCTWGHEGASALNTLGSTLVQSPAYTDGKASVIDTIGAGDTFIAGMLYGLIRHACDWTLQHQLDFANELAGRKVVQEGFSGLGKLMQRGL